MPIKFNVCKVISLAAILLSAVSVANASSGFKLKGVFPVTESVRSLALADFNHDGILDVAVATNGFNNTVSVLLGNGDGTFQPEIVLAVGSFPYGVAAGDVNHDGNFDVLVANYVDDTMSVLLGNGDGSFQAQMVFPTGHHPTSIVLGDFNNDGIPDVVTASTGVMLLLGNGDGTFQAPLDIFSAGAYSVGVADFNRDGKLDITVAFSIGTNGVLDVLLGKGDGTFHFGGKYFLHVADPYTTAVGDLNHDGKLDLVVSTFEKDLRVLFGHGDGTFRPAIPVPVPYSAYAAVLGDFNRDANLDVAIADFNNPAYLSVLTGNGDGTFQPVANYNAHADEADAIVTGDLNGDGSLDLVVGNQSANLSVFLNTGGTFLKTTSSLNPSHVGDSVTFTTTAKQGVPGTGVPTGTVTFKDGNTVLGTVPLNSGAAMFTTSTLSAGSHKIVASYSGDTNFNPNDAKALVQIVNP